MLKAKKEKQFRLTSFQIIVTYYFLTVSFATIALSMPFALQDGVKMSFIDAFFLAASAVSVTGLTTVNLSETFSTTGIVIIIFVLQIGGIGIMTISTFFWMLFGKKVTLKQRQLIMTDQNQTRLSGVVKMLTQILYLILMIELIGAIILGTYFLKYYPTWQEAFLQGIFTSVSATTNAGFDITGASLVPFANDYFVQFIIMILIILGAIGFPVLIETKNFLFHNHAKQRFRFSLFTKLTTFTYFSLFIFGAIMILTLESKHFFADKTWHETLFYSIFQSTTLRSAGLATTDMNEFSMPSLLFMALLMFIGASPSSVGGGIRTTTFALNILFVIQFARGKRHIKIFNKEIYNEDIYRSVVVFMLAVFMCTISVFLLTITEDQPLIAIIYEVTSAFGTTGSSMGITADLSLMGKLLLIILMFIGRVGILSFLFSIGGREKQAHYRFPKERVIIG